jgi:hypothetical protein
MTIPKSTGSAIKIQYTAIKNKPVHDSLLKEEMLYGFEF